MKRLVTWELILVTLIFLLGTFLRIYQTNYPLGLHGDEAWTGIEALKFLAGEPMGIWSLGLRQPNIIVYWTAFLFHIFTPDLQTLRLSYTIFWIISLPFFYGIVRILFGKSIALVAFFLFVIDRTLIHFSHIAYSPFIPPFLICTFFFLYAIKNKKTWLFALSGFLTGLSLYFYLALLVLPLLFFSYLLYVYHKPNDFRKSKNAMLMFLFCFLIATIPLGVETLSNSSVAKSRTEAISIFSEKTLHHIRASNKSEETSLTVLFDQLGKTLLLFHVSGDSDSQDNINSLPLLDRVSGIFFLLGFVYCIRNIRKKPFVFLLLWFSIFLLGTIVITGAPNFRRIQPSIAATTVIVALGIVWSYQSFVKRFSAYRFIYQFLILISIVSICYANPYFYFAKQATADSTRYVFGYQILKTAELLSNINKTYPNTYTYLYSTNFDLLHPTIQFIVPGVQGETRAGSSFLINTRKQSVVYVFSASYYKSFEEVRKLYRGGKDYLVKDVNGEVLLYAYLIVD